MNYTRNCRIKLWTCRIIDFLILVAPIAYYVCLCYADVEVTSGAKITLTASLVIGAILLMINVILKFNLRCPLWIIIIGVYYSLGDIMTLIILIAIATVVDELILSPLIRRYHTELIANIAMDRRGL